MESLNFVNLIQAATVGTSMLGGFLLWRKHSFHGIALLLLLIALTSTINILEETGVTRDIYLISPIFIMLLGPANYLAVKFITKQTLAIKDWLHLLPVAPVLFFTSHVAAVIAIGTVWRLGYSFVTAKLLIKYKKALDQERSDADEFSLNWLVWIVVGTALFNLVDIIRLNVQPFIPYELNVFGQGVNNLVWLLAVMVVTVKLANQLALPSAVISAADQQSAEVDPVQVEDDYTSTFNELDDLIVTNQWFLQPRLTLSDVSELTGLQTRDISRAINTVANKSFNDYINGYRIKQICQLLDGQSPITLTQLYTDAGFSSKASFNKIFKEHKGMTPSDYRSQVGQS